MANKNYYDVLGVSKTASDDDIRKSYRQLAKKYHPDVSKEANAEEKFKEVQEAYSVLSDKEKRSNYDQFGSAEGFGGNSQGFGGNSQGFGGFSQGFGGFDFGDIFSSMFGGGQQQRNSNPNARMQGSDLEMTVKITFLEAALGGTKTFNLTRETNCKTCSGSGAKSQSDISICSNCRGSGSVRTTRQSIFGNIVSETTCPRCSGSGKTIKTKCMTCNGNGREKSSTKLDINIPSGVDNGMSLRVPGKGNDGINGGPAGDLYLNFKVDKHKLFQRDDLDIIVNIDITFSEAALGSSREIPTIHGDVLLKIPSGIQSKTKLRLKQKGIHRQSKIGDQYVVVSVVTPEKVTGEEKSLFEKLSKVTSKQKDNFIKKIKDLFTK